MNYIDQKLLDDHLSVVTYVNGMIQTNEGTPTGDLYKSLVQQPEHIYQIFGAGYYTLEAISSLISSLSHWIEDDGDYRIVRVLDERASTLFTRLNIDKEDTPHYKYSIVAGYEGDSCYLEVEDIVYLFKCREDASNYYNQHKEHIEHIEGARRPYLERRKNPYFKAWRELDNKGDKYLEEKFNERYCEDDELEESNRKG